MDELRGFLGDKFSPKSDHWLRQQVAWEYDPARQHYLAFVREVMSTRTPGCDVLDYDCGTGWAGLALAEHGFKPSFAGEGKCVEFLKWRLGQRGLSYKVHDLKNAPYLPLVVSFDSLLKHKNAWAAIQELATVGETVIFNLNRNWPIIKDSIYSVDVDVLAQQIKENFTILSYKTYDHYAHLFAIPGVERREKDDVE